MTTVVIRMGHGEQSKANKVYIGRPSKWGNPHVIGKDGDREAVIAAYKRFFHSNAPAAMQLRKEALTELKDKVLICFCKPAACHGDVLADYVNSNGVMELL